MQTIYIFYIRMTCHFYSQIQSMTFTLDSRWVSVTTLRGTTHLFPITTYGGCHRLYSLNFKEMCHLVTLHNIFCGIITFAWSHLLSTYFCLLISLTFVYFTYICLIYLLLSTYFCLFTSLLSTYFTFFCLYFLNLLLSTLLLSTYCTFVYSYYY